MREEETERRKSVFKFFPLEEKVYPVSWHKISGSLLFLSKNFPGFSSHLSGCDTDSDRISFSCLFNPPSAVFTVNSFKPLCFLILPSFHSFFSLWYNSLSLTAFEHSFRNLIPVPSVTDIFASWRNLFFLFFSCVFVWKLCEEERKRFFAFSQQREEWDKEIFCFNAIFWCKHTDTNRLMANKQYFLRTKSHSMVDSVGGFKHTHRKRERERFGLAT